MSKNPATFNPLTLKPTKKEAFLVDTHCHIHDSEFAAKYAESADELINEAEAAGVKSVICVGTSLVNSLEAVAFVQGRANCYAAVALHPHEVADRSSHQLSLEVAALSKLLSENATKRIAAVGECGLDYFYHIDEEARNRQKQLLREHLEMALKYDLPLIFHVRDAPVVSETTTGQAPQQEEPTMGQAFGDFFKIVDEHKNIRGVVHSFSAGPKELEGVLARGLYVGLNGIMTFTKRSEQLQAAKMVPSSKLLLETDAPFLTPAPFRGKMCKPRHLRTTAEFLSQLRGESLDQLARTTSLNAEKLFGIKVGEN